MIKKQDRNKYDESNRLEPEKGQRVFLSCNKTSSSCPSLASSPLTEEGFIQLKKLEPILQSIHRRMVLEKRRLGDQKN